MKNRQEKHGAKNDDWETPEYILKYIRNEFGDLYDPCPLKANFDGLVRDWGGGELY